MVLEHEPFTRTRLDEERSKDKGKTSGVWFNNEELAALEQLAAFFHQEKESTVVKHCVEVARATILEGRRPEVVIREIVFHNVRKNRRLGIEEVAPKFRIS